MSDRFSCPCGQVLRAAEGQIGKPVRCPRCSQAILVPARPVAAPSPPPQTPPAAVRSWLYPPAAENNLLALTGDTLWRLSEVFTSCEPKQKALEASGDAAAVLGTGALRIPLEAIEKVEADRRRANLIVWYAEKDEKGLRVEKSAEFFIDEPAKRDEVIAALTERLGPGWTAGEREVGLAEAIGGHVLCIALTALAAPILLWVIHFFQGEDLFTGVPGGIFYRIGRAVIHLAQSLLRWLGVILDWTVLGLAAVLCVVWAVQMIGRIRTPPLMWTMERPGTRP